MGPGAGLLPKHSWRLQNAFGPVGIPLKKGALGARDEPNPSKEN